MLAKRTPPKAQRLTKARQWALQYDGRHIVKAYRKRFGVDRMTAINDLGEIGVLDHDKLLQMQQQEHERLELLRRQREERKAAEWLEEHKDQNDQFFFIAGYTSGGAPYGVTREEMGLEPWENPADID